MVERVVFPFRGAELGGSHVATFTLATAIQRQSDTECVVCWAPTVTLQDPPRGRYDFRWYEGDAAFDTVSVEID